jgi:glycosyltransferase involved in cell wall biosynthesis
MRVCLDVSAAVHRRAGIGRFTQELLAALPALDASVTYTGFYNRAADARPEPPLDRLPGASVPWGDKPWRLRVLLSHLFKRPYDHLFAGADLFHGADHLLPHLRVMPGIFTLYDLTYLVTQTHTTLNRLYLTLMMPRFLAAARAVIVISESTRRDVLRHYDVAEDKLRLVYGGVNRRFCPAAPDDIAAVRRKYDLPERFILAVGTIEPRKNYETLLAAYRALRDRGPDIGLVIAGRRGWRAESFFRQLHDLGLADRVRLLGYVAEADLPALYSAAEVFAFPSLYEGFGLPVLEAMACGASVVASNTSSLPEVVSDAGLLVAPDDVRGLTGALAAVSESRALRVELREKGFQQARRFTWQATAQATLEVYRSVFDAR